jgi:MFS family permease
MRRFTYKNYLLILLTVISTFNFLDRTALSIALQNIKTDLHLSDTELGFLSGIAFAFFYAIMGIPIARWADRGNRIAIIALTTALWSVMVALCGQATSFLQLLLFRVGVAVGESGCLPPANSLIPEYFSRAERPKAVGIYSMGAPLSSLFGFFFAGWLVQLFGWRMMFLIIALPGTVLAAAAWLTLQEPRLMKSTSGPTGISAAARQAQVGMKEVVLTLWRNLSFRHLSILFCIWCFFGNGMGQWTPAFFIRSFGFTTGEVGMWMALAYGLTGLIGNYVGGLLATRYLAGKERQQFQGMALLFCFQPLMWMAMFLTRNASVALALLAIGILAQGATAGPIYAALQTLVPPRMRATAIAILWLFGNLIGLGLGPLSAGALSDALRPHFGEDSLRYALFALCPGYFWCAWHLWRATKTVERDIEAVRHFGERSSESQGDPQDRMVNASTKTSTAPTSRIGGLR